MGVWVGYLPEDQKQTPNVERRTPNGGTLNPICPINPISRIPFISRLDRVSPHRQ